MDNVEAFVKSLLTDEEQEKVEEIVAELMNDRPEIKVNP